MQAQADVLKLDAVTRRFGTGQTSVNAVDGVSLSVAANEQVALEGRSGSGKTTLLSLMGMIDRPTLGDVQFKGKSVGSLDEDGRADLRRGHVGLVFQLFHLVPALSALENVLVPLLPYSRRSEIEPRARDLLQQIGLGDRISHRPAQLSGGEQQRVAIARALLNEPELVLADEPTGNLDSRTSQQVMSLLADLQAERNFALVIATHDERIASRMERRVVMSDGKIRDEV